MKLKENINRLFGAFAYADAAELLTTQKKLTLLAGSPVPATQAGGHVSNTPRMTARPRVGLYLGSELPDDVMQYAIQTCGRLSHGLTVLTFQSKPEAQAILAPFSDALRDAAIDVRIVALKGEPLSSLAYSLRRRPEVTFLICNESGYLGSGLLTGRVRDDTIPVPVVLVAGNTTALASRVTPDRLPRTA